MRLPPRVSLSSGGDVRGELQGWVILGHTTVGGVGWGGVGIGVSGSVSVRRPGSRPVRPGIPPPPGGPRAPCARHAMIPPGSWDN
eukprot:602248-Hanusia_phi.AAC.2